jgi:hypothetical protein
MASEDVQPLGAGAWESGCEQTRKDSQGRLHPSPQLGRAHRAGQNHADQKEVEALETACCTAHPCGSQGRILTLLHCPDSIQHHDPPDLLTNSCRRVYQPLVPLPNQSSPQAVLHLV